MVAGASSLFFFLLPTVAFSDYLQNKRKSNKHKINQFSSSNLGSCSSLRLDCPWEVVVGVDRKEMERK